MNKNKLWFREEDSGGGSGGNAPESRGAGVFDGGGSPDPTPAATGETPATTTPPAPAFDAKAVASELGAVIKDALKPVEGERQKLTPEEARKLLKVWEPDDDFIKRFGNIETQKAAIIEMRDAMLVQFDTLGQMRLNELGQSLEGKFKPAFEYVTKAEQRERDQDFGKAYPQLADEKLKPIVTAVANQLKAAGTKYENEKAHFDAVASGVEAVLKISNPDFKLTVSAGSTPADKTTSRPANALVPSTQGSGGGGSGDRSTAPPTKRGLAVFEGMK